MLCCVNPKNKTFINQNVYIVSASDVWPCAVQHELYAEISSPLTRQCHDRNLRKQV